MTHGALLFGAQVWVGRKVWLKGGIAGTAAHHVVSPGADAGSSSTSQKWKYHCEDDIHPDNLDELGDDGWEMVGMTAIGDHGDIRYCFERPR